MSPFGAWSSTYATVDPTRAKVVTKTNFNMVLFYCAIIVAEKSIWRIFYLKRMMFVGYVRFVTADKKVRSILSGGYT